MVVVRGVAFMWWRKADSNGVQRNRRNNAEADELQGRTATLEMVQNPMRERPRRATSAAAQNDRSSGGGSSNATESESGPGTNLEGGDATDAADVYYSEVATLSRRLPMQQASPCTLLLPDGGVAYSRSTNTSASGVLAPGTNAGAGAYESSAVINTRMHSPKGKHGNRDSRAVSGGNSWRV